MDYFSLEGIYQFSFSEEIKHGHISEGIDSNIRPRHTEHANNKGADQRGCAV